MSPGTLLEFARVNDAAAATTKKLQKQAILAAYLREIESDDDLRLTVRYASGRAFAPTDERVLGAWRQVRAAARLLPNATLQQKIATGFQCGPRPRSM